MQKKKPSSLSKKQKVSLVFGVIAAILIGWGVWILFEPHPLGNDGKIEYVGRQAYGQVPFLSDSKPGTTYFYETDLTPPELVLYFTDTTLANPNDITEWQKQDGSIGLGLNTKTGDFFGLFFYTDGARKAHSFGLQSKKKYFFTLDSKYYQTAKDSL